MIETILGSIVIIIGAGAPMLFILANISIQMHYNKLWKEAKRKLQREGVDAPSNRAIALEQVLLIADEGKQ